MNMTDPISMTTATAVSAPETDYASPAAAPAEPGSAPLMPDPLPASSCSVDPTFALGALYVQMLQTERSASRKNAVLEEARIQREADKKIDDMRKAADERFKHAMVSGFTKIGSGGLQATPGIRDLCGQEVTDNNRMLFGGSAKAAEGFGELIAADCERDASRADRTAERHDSNAEAATRRRSLESDSGSELKAQLERVLGYMQELEQARAQALSAAVLRA
jgi:hypothetical protein